MTSDHIHKHHFSQYLTNHRYLAQKNKKFVEDIGNRKDGEGQVSFVDSNTNQKYTEAVNIQCESESQLQTEDCSNINFQSISSKQESNDLLDGIPQKESNADSKCNEFTYKLMQDVDIEIRADDEQTVLLTGMIYKAKYS